MSVEPTPIHPVIASKSDFSDRLSPMIVKELRQGLRTRSFVSIFLGLQILLAFLILGSATSSSNAESGDTISAMIMLLFGIVSLIFQPLRGISAVTVEIKRNTIDLISLTKLSAWRIVYGKWLSLVSQTALLFITVVPYLVLRYFFGGMALFSELLILTTIFILSAVFTAMTVGFSTNPLTVVRWLLPVIGIPALLLFGIALLESSRYSGRGPFPDDFFALATTEHQSIFFGMIGFAIYVGYYFLDMGATAIAPLAENRATRKRIIGLTALIAVVVGFAYSSYDDAAIVLGTIITLMLGLDVLSERKEFAPSVVHAFKRAALPLRITRRLLYPGWPSGILFFLGIATFIVGMQFILDVDRDVTSFCVVSVYSLLFPAMLARFFEEKIPNLFGFHIIVWLCSLITIGVAGILAASTSSDDILFLLIPVPFGGMTLSGSQGLDRYEMQLIFMALSFACWLLCFSRASPHYAEISRIEKSTPEDHE